MPEKILIIEDNLRVAEILRQIFQILGYETHVAHDGEEGTEAFYQVKPDLVILDVIMPKKNGYQVCREIKGSPMTARVPVILLTARNLKEDVAWGYDCGADAYICKPYEPKVLEETAARLIREGKEGRHSLSWTGLHSSEVIQAQLDQCIARSEDVALLEARFNERSVEVYSLKYGNAQYRELIQSCAQLLPRLLQSRSPLAVCGQDAANTFLILLPAADAVAVETAISSVFNATAAAFYDQGDILRGNIALRDPITGSQEQIPLMQLEITHRYPSVEAERKLRILPPNVSLPSTG